MTEFRLDVRIYYEDTDAGGVVYYANYLKYMERARTQWLGRLGFAQAELARSHGILFAVRAVTVDYRQPAGLDDELEVSAALTEVKRASLGFRHAVMRPADDCLLVTGAVRVACLRGADLRPCPIPSDLREAFLRVA